MTTNKKHKHYDCIVGFAEGKEIQFMGDEDKIWIDCPFPMWIEEVVYRIKPDKKTIKFHNYLYKINDKYYIGVYYENDENVIKEIFIKWFGNWKEVEVDE